MTSRGGCTDRGGEVRGGAGEEEGGRGRRRRRTRAGLLGDLKNMAKGVICWAGDGSVSAG